MNDLNNRNPVLLIHGIDDTTAIFKKMAYYLTGKGWYVYDLDLIPNNGDAGLDKLAEQVAKWIAKTFAPEQQLDIVGFSMGGIVSRYYVQRLGGINRVGRFITVSSPHNGTVTGYLRSGPGCVQMRPKSAFLADLNQDAAMLEQVNFTSIWTPYDLMIVPPTSSKMPVGREVQVPVLGHAWMVTDRRSLDAIAIALSQPIKRDRPPEQIRDRQKSLQNDSKI